MADFKIMLLNGLKMLRAAWDSITPTVIANCFRKAGFTPALTASTELEEEADQETSLDILNRETPCSFEEYVLCDEEVQCAPMPTTDDIMGSLLTSHRDNEDDVDDHRDELPHITYSKLPSPIVYSSIPPGIR